MNINKNTVENVAEDFMQKVKPESLEAMIDVLCNGSSVLSAAQKFGVSHQSLAKNINRFHDLTDKLNSHKKQDIMVCIWTSKTIRAIYIKAMYDGFWEDFADEGLEDTVEMMQKLGFKNAQDLLIYINSKQSEVSAFLKALHQKHGQEKGIKWRISFCFIVQLMLILGFTEQFSLEELEKKGWEASIAKLVLDTSSSFAKTA